jgi:hypothetical protein
MSSDVLAMYVTGAAIAGAALAMLFARSGEEERYRQLISKRKAEMDFSLHATQDPCADIKDVASSGELQPQYLTHIGTVPGTYGSTRYLYKTNMTGSIVSTYSPLLVMNNRRV